jgi:lysozyme
MKKHICKDLAKFCALYSQYGKDLVLLGALAYNCGPGVVNKSTVLKKLKRGDRNIFKAYTSHCRYKGKWYKGLCNRKLTEFAALYVP